MCLERHEKHTESQLHEHKVTDAEENYPEQRRRPVVVVCREHDVGKQVGGEQQPRPQQ